MTWAFPSKAPALVKDKSVNTAVSTVPLHSWHRCPAHPSTTMAKNLPLCQLSTCWDEPLTIRWVHEHSPCWSGSVFLDTMALMAGKVMLDMAATAPAAHIILGREETAVRNSHSLALCCRVGEATEGEKCGQTLTKAVIQSRTRQAAGSGSLVPGGWCFYFLLNA